MVYNLLAHKTRKSNYDRQWVGADYNKGDMKICFLKTLLKCLQLQLHELGRQLNLPGRVK